MSNIREALEYSNHIVFTEKCAEVEKLKSEVQGFEVVYKTQTEELTKLHDKYNRLMEVALPIYRRLRRLYVDGLIAEPEDSAMLNQFEVIKNENKTL
jgi:hypothetical protein